MDRDFHFGATYHAARLANFTESEANIIAHAAQYVDHFSSSALNAVKKYVRDSAPQYDGKGLAQTVQETLALTAHTTANWSGVDAYTAAIWPVFHFLPGNYGRDDIFDTGDVDRALSPLICRPYGPLAEILLETARDKWDEYQVPTGDGSKTLGALIRIGITMHVLADTFAHANFVGLPSKHLNEVHEICDANNADKEIRLLPLKDYAPTLASSGYGYLGHGRIGHLPDQPWMHYYYNNDWPAESIERNNPLIYTEAFLYLYTALAYIQGNGNLPRSSRDLLTPGDGAVITIDFTDGTLHSIDAQDKAWVALNGDVSYIHPNPDAHMAFIFSFARQAWHHRNLVLENCSPLNNLLSSNRIS